MSNLLIKSYRWCRRYISMMLLLVVAFALFVLFFNEHSVKQSVELSHEIERLEDEIRMKKDTIEKYYQLNQRLDTDPVTMERIVREHYHFQRANEDVYVFEAAADQ